MSALEPAAWARALDAIAAAIHRLDAEGWIVGGALRNILLGRPLNDIDLAVTCSPAALVSALRPAHGMSVGHLNRHTLRLVVRGGGDASQLQIDISPLRGADIHTDLTRRDFTCNALALPLDAWGELLAAAALPTADPRARRAALAPLLDPLDGTRDLTAGVLRPANPSAFADEPGRILRAARMVAAFGFTPSPETYSLAAASAPLLAELSPDRLRNEMNALLTEVACADGLCFLVETAALRVAVPSLADPAAAHHAIASVAATRLLQGDAAPAQDAHPFAQSATLPLLREEYARALHEGIPRVVALRWGLLLHAALPHTGAVMREGNEHIVPLATSARLSAQIRATVAAVAECAAWRELLAAREPTLTELRHVAERLGDGFVDLLTGTAICDLALRGANADRAAPDGVVTKRVRDILEHFFADRAAFIPPPLLDGRMLLREVGVAPGPAVGRVLRAVREAQLDGEIATCEQALAFARRALKDKGPAGAA